MARRIRLPTFVLGALSYVVLAASIAFGQEAPDSNRVSIQELEANRHRWDVLRTDAAVPAFQRGKDLAIQGRLEEAALEMRKGLKKRQAIAHFNLGVLDFEQGLYKAASAHFNTAYRLRHDPVFREYVKRTRRLLEGKKGKE